MNDTQWIVGLDCAVDPRNVGIALGRLTHSEILLEDVRICSVERTPAATTVELVDDRSPVLIAVDAPLGWPQAMGDLLPSHRAGQRIAGNPNQFVRRETDRFVKREVGTQPLDVGADRIARTALAALTILDEIASITKQSIPLAWEPSFRSDMRALEVYPAATLRAHKLKSRGYKKPEHSDNRAVIVESLRDLMNMDSNDACLVSSGHALDAAVCVLAGADFLQGEAAPPKHRTLAEKEGWIWVKRAK